MAQVDVKQSYSCDGQCLLFLVLQNLHTVKLLRLSKKLQSFSQINVFIVGKLNLHMFILHIVL